MMSSMDLAWTTTFFGVAACAEPMTAGAANPAADVASSVRLVSMISSPFRACYQVLVIFE